MVGEWSYPCWIRKPVGHLDYRCGRSRIGGGFVRIPVHGAPSSGDHCCSVKSWLQFCNGKSRHDILSRTIPNFNGHILVRSPRRFPNRPYPRHRDRPIRREHCRRRAGHQRGSCGTVSHGRLLKATTTMRAVLLSIHKASYQPPPPRPTGKPCSSTANAGNNDQLGRSVRTSGCVFQFWCVQMR